MTYPEPGRWITYAYCISICILTLRLRSDPIFVPDGASRVTPGLPYLALSMAFGWWGFPFGLVFTPMAIIENLQGGTEVHPGG